MKIVCISASQIPSDTANSIQVMKVCQAFMQLGHDVTLLVPGSQPETLSQEQLKDHYGLERLFPIHWLPGRNRRLFPWRAVRQARRMQANLIYAWPLQSAALGLLAGIPTMLELHDRPSGRFGPFWLRFFLLIARTQTPAAHHQGIAERTNIYRQIRRLLHRMGWTLSGMFRFPNQSLPAVFSACRSALTVLCTGHLYAGRGADLFLELAAKFPQTSFVWVGGRPPDVEAWKGRAGGTDQCILYWFRSKRAHPALPVRRGCADDALPAYSRHLQRWEYCRDLQPDENVRVHGRRARHPHQRSAGAARSAG